MITGIVAEYQRNAGSTKDTPYLALTGELWGVCCEYLWENWPRYNGTALYNVKFTCLMKISDVAAINPIMFEWDRERDNAMVSLLSSGSSSQSDKILRTS